MGTWISHLRIAENLLKELNSLDETTFVFGNLGPDCGKPNEDWTQFDPPKQITHFLHKGEGEGKIRDLEFFKLHLASVNHEEDNSRYSFLLGYFFHLMSDSLWAKKIGAAAKRDHCAFIESKGIHAWETMKEDWYGLDQKYVRNNKNCLFWRVMMPAANPPAYLDYLSKDAVQHQMDYIRHFYSKPDQDWILDRTYPYLNEQSMARYVVDSTQILLEIHQKQKHLAKLSGHTALAIISPDRLLPYDAPLGDC